MAGEESPGNGTENRVEDDLGHEEIPLIASGDVDALARVAADRAICRNGRGKETVSSASHVGAASIWKAPRGDPEAAKELQRVLVFPDQVVLEDTPRVGEGDSQT